MEESEGVKAARDALIIGNNRRNSSWSNKTCEMPPRSSRRANLSFAAPSKRSGNILIGFTLHDGSAVCMPSALPVYCIEPLGCALPSHGGTMKKRPGTSGKSAKRRTASGGPRSSGANQNAGVAAFVATENASLLNEPLQRTADLTEALERQKATSDVLSIIGVSKGELTPIFQVMLQNATRICEAQFGVVFRFDGMSFTLRRKSAPPDFAEYLSRSIPQPLPGSHLDRLKQTKQVSCTADYAAEGIPAPPVTLGGARSTVDVPILKGDELIGAFSIYRQEVRPFTEKQVSLVQNFAAQAVIAIENARLLNELRQRTTELTEALKQQTATADVLKVISRSQFDLQLVLDSLIQTAASLCSAKRGVIFRRDGELYRAAAFYNATPELIEYCRRPSGYQARAPTPSLQGLAVATSSDPRCGPSRKIRNTPTPCGDAEPIRTELGVPMFRGDDLCRRQFILYKLKVRALHRQAD